MDIDHLTPLQILETRHSVRSYSEQTVPECVLNKIKAAVTMVNSHEAGIKFRVITDDPNPFKGFDKSYGMFINPRHYIAAVVDPSYPDIYERVGYFAEEVVIKATLEGLATCFVGGTFHSDKVNTPLRAGEKILFLILFGYPQEKTRLTARLISSFAHRKKMRAADFFTPKSDLQESLDNFPILETGLKGIACAPSALNRRPTRVFIHEINGKKRICAKVDKPDNGLLIDLGIAKFNFNYATNTLCDWGNGAALVTE